MIQILFFIFVALVVFHFIYEGIIAPSMRFESRTKLFALRDKLRMLKLQHPDKLTDEVYFYLQNEINKQLRLMFYYNMINVVEAYKHTQQSEIVKRVEEIEEMINASPINEVRYIHDKTATLFARTLIANSGAWSLYLLPFVVLFFMGLIAILRIRRFYTQINLASDEEFAIA